MRTLVTILCLACTGSAAAEELQKADVRAPQEVLIAAHSAYDAGRYADAAELYETLIQGGSDNGHLYYNLGNAYLRAGRVGRAIAAYRIAQSRLPRDQDVAANLKFARSLTKDAVAPAEATPVLRTLFFWHYSTSLRELLVGMVVVNLLFWTTLALLLYRRQSEILRWAAVVQLLVLLSAGTSAAVRALRPRRVAVIQQHQVDVHSGTSHDTVVRFKLHEGAEATVVDLDGDWARIELPSGEQGWIERSDIAVIAL